MTLSPITKALVLGCLIALSACADEKGMTGTRDASTATGGLLATGGAASTGGSPTLGGVTATGGVQAMGGIVHTGGLPVTGGIVATGGILQTGGMVITGGSRATGGIVATGGVNRSGGAILTGGSPATGGAVSCGGVIDMACPASQFCEVGVNQCTTVNAPGTCVTVSQACPAIYQPVCGCNNKTYGNDCERQGARVSKRSDGACPTADAGTGTADAAKLCGVVGGIVCASTQFCEFPAATCDIEGNGGTCAVVSEVCTANYAPVCGCDNKTYSNDCVRRGAKVSKRSDGVCPTVDAGVSKDDAGKRCGGIAGLACGTGEFCEFPAATCLTRDGFGTCATTPTACNKLLSPVCGCDNKTYGNDCERQRAGVSLSATGNCP